MSAGHYGVGATIADSTGRHLLDLRFDLSANHPSGGFTGDPGTYNVTLSGPSSFAVSDVGKPVSYTLGLTTYTITTESARNWSKFCLISIPSLVILLFLVLLLTVKTEGELPPSVVEPTREEKPPIPGWLSVDELRSKVPPDGTIWHVPTGGLPTTTPPPKSEQQIINETRQQAHDTLNALLGLALLSPDSGAKWYDLILRATSEAELKHIIDALDAIGAGGAGRSFEDFDGEPWL